MKRTKGRNIFCAFLLKVKTYQDEINQEALKVYWTLPIQFIKTNKRIDVSTAKVASDKTELRVKTFIRNLSQNVCNEVMKNIYSDIL